MGIAKCSKIEWKRSKARVRVPYVASVEAYPAARIMVSDKTL